MKQVMLISDIHLGANVFKDYIRNTLDSILDTACDKLEKGSDIIWLGDVIDRWKSIQDDDILHYLTYIFANKLKDFNHYVIKGNHDLNPKTGKSCLTFLDELNNVTVVNEPYEYTPQILLVPHNYNGYTLEKRYSYIIAHLGLYGATMNESKTKYTSDDLLTWHIDTTPTTVFLGHIHKRQIIEQVDCTIDILGSISVTTWGDASVTQLPKVIPVMILNNELFTSRVDYNIKQEVTTRIDETSNTRYICVDNEVMFEEDYTKPFKPQAIRNKGNTIEEIIDTVCKEKGVDTATVKLFLKGIGLNDIEN